MSTSRPRTMKALTISATNKTITLDLVRPVPTPRPDQILVSVVAVALNPTDWKHVAYGISTDGALSGCDYAGRVLEIGNDVTKKFQIGDRVAGVAHGANASNVNDGVFAEYAVVKGDLQVKIPESLKFEQAATFPLGVSTVNQGLFQKALHLTPPSTTSALTTPPSGAYVLIYGGSTATGALAIQLARLANYRVLTTCSKRSTDLVLSLGAEKAFDYTSPTCGADINNYTNNELLYAYDPIADSASAAICAEALTSEVHKARYGSTQPVKLPGRAEGDVYTEATLMYSIFNEAFIKGGKETPASREDFESAKSIFGVVEELLKDGRLKTHAETVGKEGLKGVLKGLVNMKEGRVHGEKLVYLVGETPGEEGLSESFA